MDLADRGRPFHVRLHRRQVTVRPSGSDSLVRQLLGPGYERHRAELNLGTHSARVGHATQVAQQSESGDVDAGVNADAGHRLGRGAIEVAHDLHGGLQHLFGRYALLAGGRDDPGPQRLGQHQHIVGLRARVCDLRAWPDYSSDRQPVLGLFVVRGVTAHDQHACFLRLVTAAGKYLA